MRNWYVKLKMIDCFFNNNKIKKETLVVGQPLGVLFLKEDHFSHSQHPSVICSSFCTDRQDVMCSSPSTMSQVLQHLSSACIWEVIFDFVHLFLAFSQDYSDSIISHNYFQIYFSSSQYIHYVDKIIKVIHNIMFLNLSI